MNYQCKFYVVSIDDSDPDALSSPQKDTKGLDRFCLYKGKWIQDWPEGVTFWFTEGEHPQDYMMGGAYWPLVSERVRLVFEQHQIGGVQFLPVRVFRKKTNNEVGKYWALHVVQEVEALDWTHTIWTTLDIKKIEEHPLLSILLPALIWEKVKDVDIFRLKVREKAGFQAFVSAKLKTFLEEAGATSGFAFLPRKAY